MATKQYLFADRIIGISVQGTTARIDFGVATQTATKEGKTEAKVDPTHQLILPLDSFIQAVAVQEKVAKELITRSKKRRDSKTTTPAPDKAA